MMIDFSFLCALSVLVRFKTLFGVNVNVQFYDGVQKLFEICTQHSKIKRNRKRATKAGGRERVCSGRSCVIH